MAMSSGGEQVPSEDSAAETTTTTAQSPEQHRWRFGGLELFVAIMLGLTAIASAYSAWRNEQRNHEAAAHFSEGIRDYDNGGQFYGEGQSVMSRDQSLFLEYAKAKQLGQEKLADYIFLNLMSPTLQGGVRWWQGPNQSTSHPSRNPFTPHDPAYKIQQLADADQSYDASKKNFTEARAEQEKADHYTLIEVILATALFLYGVAGVTRNPRLKRATVAMGTVIFVVALVLLITG